MSNLRRQTIIIAVLIVLIGCAGYFAKRFNDTAQNTGALSSSLKKQTTNFFAESRMGRDNQRSAMKEEFEKIISDDKANKEAKAAASTKLMQILDWGNKENTVETLVKERGFEDAICFIDDNGVELCVKTNEQLTEEQANQLKDIIVRTTHVSPSNITIKSKQ
ncbi:stage III sporulation protein AH [Caloramator quimbayensis]|uniref:Stage III sporulation protein AH n=1 Tax=Caloramator quimbayensis TaxID=1147123 RepID=A0A1T4WXT8_9CLOT|nr:SpoIIIAH-like family protein [Caloramator quimbayensis]SKA81967.1 stage III sporulation protein AH [Caloramator quimbayensis]